MKVAFYTLGCKVNQYETQLMSESFKTAGYAVVDCSEQADVYVINSCTVTAASNQKTRQSLRAFKRKHPACITVLTGCMSQAYPDEAKALAEADIIIGNTDHAHLPELVAAYMQENNKIVNICAHETGEAFESGIIHTFDNKTRAEVKIEDGCNRFCAYCAIPYARGRVRSKPMREVEKELTALAAAGYKEVVLVGINLSAYDDGGKTIADVVETAESIDGICRVRLGSLEPDHITPQMMDKLAACSKFCPHFHISLQSGCDKTLKAMNRHYNSEEYTALCELLRSRFEECTLTTDVMVGFPGETQEDFEESLAFVKKIGFEKIHVFPYSVREGTKAATMPGQLTKAVKSARAKKMIALGDEMRAAFLHRQIGKEIQVLVESKKGSHFLAHSKNYLPVKIQSDDNLQDKLITVTILSADNEWCYAEKK